MKKNTVSTFHNELNSIYLDMYFTIELEQDGLIPFLDPPDGTITTTVCCKLPLTDP